MQQTSPTPIRGMTYIPDDGSPVSRKKAVPPPGPLVRPPSKPTHTKDLNAPESFLNPRTPPPLTRKPSLLVHEALTHATESRQREHSRTASQLGRARSRSKRRSDVTPDKRRSDDQAHRHSARYSTPSSNLRDSIRHLSLSRGYSNDGSPEGKTSSSPPRSNEYTSILDPAIKHNTALPLSIDNATSSSPLEDRLEFNFPSVVEDPKPRRGHHIVNTVRIVDRPRGRSQRPQAKSQASSPRTFYDSPGSDYPPQTPPEDFVSARASPEDRSPEEQADASPTPIRTVPYARPTPTNSPYLAARPKVPTRRKPTAPHPRTLHPASTHATHPPRSPTTPDFKAIPYATYSTPHSPLPAQPRRVAVLQQPEALRSCWFESTEGSDDGEGESTSHKRAQFRKILHNRISLGTLNVALGSVVGLVSKENGTAATAGSDLEKTAGLAPKIPRWSWIPATQPGSWPLPPATAHGRGASDGRDHIDVRNSPNARPARARSTNRSLSRIRAKSSTALRTRKNRSGSKGGRGRVRSWILRLLCDG